MDDVLPEFEKPLEADHEYTRFWTCGVEVGHQPVWRPWGKSETPVTTDSLDTMPNLKKSFGLATCRDVAFGINPCTNETSVYYGSLFC